jgi:hypothetical protein
MNDYKEYLLIDDTPWSKEYRCMKKTEPLNQ